MVKETIILSKKEFWNTQRCSRHPFVCAVWPFRTACFMNENEKKSWMGIFPWSHDHDSCTMAFGNPLLYVWEKKKPVEKPFPSVSYSRFKTLQFHWEIYNSIVSMYPYERGWVSMVVCHLFVVRVPERSAVCSQDLCVVSGEASANFERPSRSHFSLDSRQLAMLVYLITRPLQRCRFIIGHKLTSNEARKLGRVTVVSLRSGERRSVGLFRTTVTESFLVGFSPTSYPRFANDKGFATVCLFLKSDTNWLQAKPRKIGLVTVVWARTSPPPPPPPPPQKKEEYRSSFRTTGSCFRVNKTMSRSGEFPCVFSSVVV